MVLLKRILFVLLLLGLIGGEVLRFDNGQGIAITFFDVTVVVFVGLTLLFNFFQKQPLIVTKAHKFVLWFVGIGLVSLLLQIFQLTPYQTIVATLYAIRFLIYTLGISWSVQLLDKEFKNRIVYVLFGTSMILAVGGFLQYFFYPYLRNLYYAGWDPHLYRIFSTFLDPNFMALFYICGAILGWSILLRGDTSSRRRNYIVIVLTLVNFLAAIFTHSRGGYVAGIIGIGIFAWREGFKTNIFKKIPLVIVLVVVLGLYGPRSEGTKLLRTASIRDRVVSLREVTTIIAHHPFLGVGFDAYRYAQQREGFLLSKADVTHSGAGTDNSFLFVFATTGIAGLIAYLLMTYNILKMSYGSTTIAGRALFASYITLIVGSFFVNALFYPFLLVWMWILVEL